jgi:hypothetical protein
MGKKRASASRSKGLSSVSIFGPPPLLEGEDAADYEELLARLSKAVLLVSCGNRAPWRCFRQT